MKQAKVYHKVHIIKGKEYHVESLTDTGRAEKEMTAIMALIKSTKLISLPSTRIDLKMLSRLFLKFVVFSRIFS